MGCICINSPLGFIGVHCTGMDPGVRVIIGCLTVLSRQGDIFWQSSLKIPVVGKLTLNLEPYLHDSTLNYVS